MTKGKRSVHQQVARRPHHQKRCTLVVEAANVVSVSGNPDPRLLWSSCTGHHVIANLMRPKPAPVPSMAWKSCRPSSNHLSNEAPGCQRIIVRVIVMVIITISGSSKAMVMVVVFIITIIHNISPSP